MKQVRLISVAFDTEIAPHETSAFRGAVIEKVGQEREQYHNHNNSPKAKSPYHYRYPLVQYKRQRRRPSIVFIDEGVNEAQHFFAQPDWRLNFGGREYSASIADLRVKQYPVGISEQPKYYTLHRWLGLNQVNFERFMGMADEAEQLAFLEHTLAGHILGFGSAIGHRYEARVEVSILHIFKRRFVPVSGVPMLAFDFRFCANVLLPPQISLGRGAARGFGILRHWNPEREQAKQS